MMDNKDILEITAIHRFSDVAEERVPENVHLDVFGEVLEVEINEAYESAGAVAK